MDQMHLTQTRNQTIDKICSNCTSGAQFERYETECHTRVVQVYNDQHAQSHKKFFSLFSFAVMILIAYHKL